MRSSSGWFRATPFCVVVEPIPMPGGGPEGGGADRRHRGAGAPRGGSGERQVSRLLGRRRRRSSATSPRWRSWRLCARFPLPNGRARQQPSGRSQGPAAAVGFWKCTTHFRAFLEVFRAYQVCRAYLEVLTALQQLFRTFRELFMAFRELFKRSGNCLGRSRYT